MVLGFIDICNHIVFIILLRTIEFRRNQGNDLLKISIMITSKLTHLAIKAAEFEIKIRILA